MTCDSAPVNSAQKKINHFKIIIKIMPSALTLLIQCLAKIQPVKTLLQQC